MKSISLVVMAALVITPVCEASWTLLPLPDTQSYETTALGHLADGRFLYGHSGSLIQQNSFGSAAATAFGNAPAGDYAYVTASHVGVFLTGTSSYDSTDTTSAFTLRDGTIKAIYAGADWAGGVLMTGAVGFGSPSGLYYISASGTLTTLVADFSPYSGGLAVDSAGNVFVAYSDATGTGLDNDIYRFAAADVGAAIAGTPMTLANATFVGNLGVSGSLAYDSTLDRLYAAGWQENNGLRVLDLTSGITGTLALPGYGNYGVSTFSHGGNDYVGWLSRSGWSGGDSVVYGYDLAAIQQIPEPGVAAFGVVSILMLCRIRRRS